MRVRSVSAREPLSEPESAGATASTSTVDLVLDLEKALERFKQMAIDSERPVEGWFFIILFFLFLFAQYLDLEKHFSHMCG